MYKLTQNRNLGFPFMATFGQFETPSLELAFFKMEPQFKNPPGPKESMYFKLQNHGKNSSIGSKLREL